MDITIYSVLIWLIAILIASFGLIVFLGSRNTSSRVFALCAFLTALWSVAQGFFIASTSEYSALFLIKLSHVLGVIISFGFLYFSLIYPDDQKPSSRIVPIFILISAIFFYLYFFTSFLISAALPFDGIQRWEWTAETGQLLFYATFFGSWVALLRNLYRRGSRAQSTREKKNLRYMFWGLLLGVTAPSILNIILPSIGYFRLNWVGVILSSVWIYIIGYSIIKYRQLSVRVFLAEVLVVSMAVLMFINIFTDIPLGIYGRAALFLIFAILGYFLIRNIVRVSIQREELGDLSKNLQKKVNEQTEEVQRAYEVEKRARIELENLNQNKNDFIIVTQHHLRTPLAQIRWYANSIASGLYGAVSSEMNNAVSRIDIATEKLIKTLHNFLEIVQMKIGTKFLVLEKASLKDTVEILLDEFSRGLKKKGLTVALSPPEESWPLVSVDVMRMKEALAILIDNAVVYNKEGGEITIEAKREQNRFVLRISNSGIGISREDGERLFRQSFFRTKEAQRVHPSGMGIGLLVAKTIIEAHGGKIRLEEGTQGQTVLSFTLPLA